MFLVRAGGLRPALTCLDKNSPECWSPCGNSAVLAAFASGALAPLRHCRGALPVFCKAKTGLYAAQADFRTGTRQDQYKESLAAGRSPGPAPSVLLTEESFLLRLSRGLPFSDGGPSGHRFRLAGATGVSDAGLPFAGVKQLLFLSFLPRALLCCREAASSLQLGRGGDGGLGCKA